MIQYPSISICKKYSIDGNPDFLGRDTFDISRIKEELQEYYTYDLEDTLYFFTHPGVMNLTFPCTTVLGGMDPAKPCIFPVNYHGYIYYECFLMDTSSPACATQQYQDDEIDFYHFGICNSQCSGEMPGPESPFNLGKIEFSSIWSTQFYDLSSFENGLCHTYDPPNKSSPGLTNRLYFMFNDLGRFSDFDIFIHEKGQFWPRSDMFTFGQPESVLASKFDDITIVFSIKEISHLNNDKNICQDDEDYSLTECIQNFAKSETKCDVDFTNSEDQSGKCSKEAFQNYFNLLIWIKQSSVTEILKRSGCRRKCKLVQYSVEVEKKQIHWNSNWSSEVYIQPRASTVQHSHEYYSFDKYDLIGSLGGYLGLFLGWSFLTFFEATTFVLSVFNSASLRKK